MIRFTKMHGIGNDFVVVDALGEQSDMDWSEFAREVNDRRLGVGSDGLLVAEKGTDAPFRMRMFNPDGSESEMCGNGIRCFGIWLRDQGHVPQDSVAVETGAGILQVYLLPDGRVRVDMGIAGRTRAEIGMSGPPDELFVNADLGGGRLGTAVSMGNPHLVLFVDEVAKVDLEVEGRRLETHPLFPNRTNVHFVQVESRGRLTQRTWERGAGATLACGTGACAVAVAGVMTGLADPTVRIQLPGGSLDIEVRDDWRVFKTGPAVTVFDGVWDAPDADGPGTA